jgi:hypothetical protein
LSPYIEKLGLNQLHKDLIFFVILTAASAAALMLVESWLKTRKKGRKV